MTDPKHRKTAHQAHCKIDRQGHKVLAICHLEIFIHERRKSSKTATKAYGQKHFHLRRQPKATLKQRTDRPNEKTSCKINNQCCQRTADSDDAGTSLGGQVTDNATTEAAKSYNQYSFKHLVISLLSLFRKVTTLFGATDPHTKFNRGRFILLRLKVFLIFASERRENAANMKILVTGASGFIGSFIVEHALDLGWTVWAGIRKTSSKKWLQAPRIHFIELELNEPKSLEASLSQFKETEGSWDYIVHAAGATKAKDEAAFFHANFEATKNLVEALEHLDLVPKCFIYMSSLSVLGAIKEQPRATSGDFIYEELSANDSPRPNTAYGRSKWAAEQYLKTRKLLPCVILRPTGVYGPRERDYFLMVKSIRQHIDFSVGFRPQEITFIYVSDVVQAVFLSFAQLKNAVGHTFILSDGKTYDSRTFSDLVRQDLGIHCLLRIKAPLWLLRIVCSFGELSARLTGNITALNKDKYHILKQRNWRCNIDPILAIGFKPQFDLERGVGKTISWYKQEEWI